MGQDIKKLFEDAQEMETRELPKSHKNRFESRLEQEFSKAKSPFSFLRIAASIALVVSLGLAGTYYLSSEQPSNQISSLAEISPELKKTEDFYLNHINYQIAKIKITEENKPFIEAYFVELGSLQEAYNNAMATINPDEISEETINALIDNLQSRLKLIYQLKAQLKKIDNLNKQENESSKA